MENDWVVDLMINPVHGDGVGDEEWLEFTFFKNREWTLLERGDDYVRLKFLFGYVKYM